MMDWQQFDDDVWYATHGGLRLMALRWTYQHGSEDWTAEVSRAAPLWWDRQPFLTLDAAKAWCEQRALALVGEPPHSR
jgi:hypothetical protein